MTIFYSDVEPLSKYSPVTIHLSPTTRILSENPLMVSVLHKGLEGKVGKLKCKTLEVMKNEKQIWNSIMWINHTRPVYMKYCSHDTVYHLLMNNNKGEGEGGWKERGFLERGAFKLKKNTARGKNLIGDFWDKLHYSPCHGGGGGAAEDGGGGGGGGGPCPPDTWEGYGPGPPGGGGGGGPPGWWWGGIPLNEQMKRSQIT